MSLCLEVISSFVIFTSNNYKTNHLVNGVSSTDTDAVVAVDVK